MTLYQLYALAAGVLVAVVILVLVLALAMRRRLSAGASSGRISREAIDLLKRLEQASRKIDAQAKAVSQQLRPLLEEAQEKIAQLQRRMDESDTREGFFPPPLQRQQDEIVRLSQSGMDALDIARRLELTVGEVELMLNLQKSQKVQA